MFFLKQTLVVWHTLYPQNWFSFVSVLAVVLLQQDTSLFHTLDYVLKISYLPVLVLDKQRSRRHKIFLHPALDISYGNLSTKFLFLYLLVTSRRSSRSLHNLRESPEELTTRILQLPHHIAWQSHISFPPVHRVFPVELRP